jgi:L-ascorbate metabolism protein UlaG (beta-lactamase superfamily)
MMKITFFGHACFLIETKSVSFLIDPFISGNPLAKDVDIDSIRCDYILLTHGHGDHVADVIQVAGNNPDVKIIANYEVAEWFAGKGQTVHHLNHGGWFAYASGRIKYVNAIHSSTMPDGSSGGCPGGFVIEAADATAYISGDTALTMDMKLIPLTCKPLDIAILCIGDNFTMGIEDAVLASDFIACDQIIGAHYDSFEPIKIDHAQAVKAFSNKNKKLHLLEIGSALEVKING